MWLEVAFDCYFRDMSTLVYVSGASGLLGGRVTVLSQVVLLFDIQWCICFVAVVSRS